MSQTGEPKTPDPNSLAKLASGQAARASRIERSVADAAAQQELDDRTLITRTVTSVFMVAVPLSLLFLLVLSLVSSDAAEDAIGAIADILKSVLLPVVTLVLGYYFGRGKA